MFAPHGRTLVSGSTDRTVRLWNVETRRELMQLDRGNIELGGIASVTFSPDGKQLVTCGSAGAIWSAAPNLWDDAGRAAEELQVLLRSGADFCSRIRMLSENLHLHEALAKLDAKDVRVQAALAATVANWHASRQDWQQAGKAFDRLVAADPTNPDGWLRVPGLLRVATALLHQDRPRDAAALLRGGAWRRAADGLVPPQIRVTGLTHAVKDGTVQITELHPGSPAAQSKLRVGDVIVKIDDTQLTTETSDTVSKMLGGDAGTKVRLTVRHPGSERLEEIELTRKTFVQDTVVGDLLNPLLTAINERIARDPRQPSLLELRAELVGQWSGTKAQVADYTAAIDVLSQNGAEAAAGDLRRLYSRRGNAHVALRQWQQAADDYALAGTDATTDKALLTNRALAHEALKQWDAAAADWSRVATDNPEGARLLAEFARKLAAHDQLSMATSQFKKSQALYERMLQVDPYSDQVAGELAQVLLDKRQMEKWTVLQPAKMQSEGGAKLTLLGDRSILASGVNPDMDAYVIEAKVDGPIGAIRLEVIPDSSMPAGGSGRAPTWGNFVLTDFRVKDGQRDIFFSRAFADFSQEIQQGKKVDFSIAQAVDDDESTGWAIWPRVAEPHWAVFIPSQPITRSGEGPLTIRLAFHSKDNKKYNLGRFRLSVSDQEPAEEEEQRFAALKNSNPWAKLAAAYHISGDQQTVDSLIKHHPEAAVGVGDAYAAVKGWDKAITEYRKVTDKEADAPLLTKLATAYQSAGRTREAVPYLARVSAANPDDTLLWLKVAALEVWFGQDKELAATRQQVLALARGTTNWDTANRASKVGSFKMSSDQTELEAALALGRKGVELEKNDWTLLALGMAEYRSGNDSAAASALLAAEKAGPKNATVMGMAPLYRAMILYRQGKPDEARKIALQAAAKMRPLPKDDQNPLVNGVSHDQLAVWLTFKEARALIKIEALPDEILTANESAGRTRDAIPYLVKASIADPEDTLLVLKVAALQAWFGEEKELAATRQRLLAFAKDKQNDAVTMRRIAKACSIQPSADKSELEAALALTRKAVKLEKNAFGLQILGMAEYRAGNDAAAVEALVAAEKSTGSSRDRRIAEFYRAMSLFRQGKTDEARKVAIATAAKMKPLPKDEQNPLVEGADHDDLILWLAYKEARAVLKMDLLEADTTSTVKELKK
jgi:tetratricopeptide (TPR) repeat protein